MEILNTVNVTVQRNIFARNLFALVGRRLAEHGLLLVIFTFQEREKLRLEYANFPKRRLKKFLSCLHIQGPPYEFPFERFPTAKQAMLRRKAIFFKSSLEYLKSRMQKREDVAHIAELARLLGPGKIIIAPMVVDRRSIGIFFMTSESLSTIDLKTVNALAVQFAHVIVHRQIHSDAEKLKRHLDVLLDSVEEAVFTTDLKGKVVSWNRASRELFGHTKGDIIGAGVSTLGIDKGLWTECMEACRQGAAKRVAGIPLTCIHGSRTANIRTFPTDSGRDRGVVFVVSPSPAGDRKPPQ
jgi:PAS domain S-box-containing protein